MSRFLAGETTSREYFKGCQLPASRGTLGIATVGDALHKLIPATSPAPCSVKEVCLFAHPLQHMAGVLQVLKGSCGHVMALDVKAWCSRVADASMPA